MAKKDKAAKAADTEKSPAKVQGAKVKDHFDAQFATVMDSWQSVKDRCAGLLDRGVLEVTIRQAAEMCGLDKFTIRSKTQSHKQKDGSYKEPILSKRLEGGRVLIPVAEIAAYELTKGTRSTVGRRQYKVYMTAEEAADFELAHPDSKPRPANLTKAEKAAKAVEEAAS